MKHRQIWGSIEEWGLERNINKNVRYFFRSIAILCFYLLLGSCYSTIEFPLLIRQQIDLTEDTCTEVRSGVDCSRALWEICDTAEQLYKENYRSLYDFFCESAKVVELWELNRVSQSEQKNKLSNESSSDPSRDELADLSKEVYVKYMLWDNSDSLSNSAKFSMSKVIEIVKNLFPILNFYEPPSELINWCDDCD